MALINVFQATILQPSSMSPAYASWELQSPPFTDIRILPRGGPLIVGNNAMTTHPSLADPSNTGEINHLGAAGANFHTCSFNVRLNTLDPFLGTFILSGTSGAIINGMACPFVVDEEGNNKSYIVRDPEIPWMDYPLPEIASGANMLGEWSYRAWEPPLLSMTLNLPFSHSPIDFVFYADIVAGEEPPAVFWTGLVNSYEK